MRGCLICSSPIEPFINFGRMPIANGFLTPEEFESFEDYPVKENWTRVYRRECKVPSTYFEAFYDVNSLGV